MFYATGLFTISRGETTDEYGDPVDTGTVLAQHVPASVIEQSRNVYSPVNGRLTTVRTVTGRFRHGIDLLAGDQLADESTGEAYVVVSVRTVASAVNKPDTVADLTRNTASG